MDQNSFGNARLTKLAAEKTALNGCRDDMSDVSFEIGKTSYTVKIFAAIVAFAVFFGGRIMLRRSAGGHEMSANDKIFWGFIAVIAVCTVVAALRQSMRPSIKVSGKTLFCGGSSWNSDDISYVKCTGFLEMVEVYSKGKKILSFPWELDNSELFIAWAKKCSIAFVDNRMNLNKF